MKKVLIIDDEKIISKRLSELLDLDGYQTYIAESGLAGLEIIKRDSPDITLLDLKMPGMSGLDVLREIGASDAKTEVIITTGHGDVKTAIEALKAGAFGYLLKPVNYDELHIDIKKALKKQSIERKLNEHVEQLEKAIFEKNEEITLRIQLEAELEKRNQEQEATILERTAQLKVANKNLEQELHEHKKADEQLQSSEEKFRKIFQSSPLAITITNMRTGEFIDANQTCERVIGYSRKELIGKTSLELNIWKNPEERQEVISKLLEKEFVEQRRAELVRKSGEIALTDNSFSLITVNGEVLTITIMNDITEQERVTMQLQQAQKMEAIGTLAGGIAHDFNNLLAAILGFTDLAKDDIPVDSPVHSDLEQVLVATHKAKDLVKQILAFSRQSETECIPLNMQPLIKEAAKLLRSSIPSTIDIQQNLEPQCGVVLADPTQIHQVLMNLCTNAYHAMEKTGGKLEIALLNREIRSADLPNEPDLEPGNYVELNVRDTGGGIPDDIRNKIFEPYFTTKEKGKGTGMGLAIVHGIMKTYKGVVRIESEMGKGTTFQLFFPIIERETEDGKESKEPVPTGSEHVLFVDDEKHLADLGKKILTNLGYIVTTRKSSLEALELFRAKPEKIDIVITDQTMPEMTGAEMAQAMLAIRPDIPIILCTGFSNIISKEKALKSGVKAFALKPLAKRDMANLIREVLDAC